MVTSLLLFPFLCLFILPLPLSPTTSPFTSHLPPTHADPQTHTHRHWESWRISTSWLSQQQRSVNVTECIASILVALCLPDHTRNSLATYTSLSCYFCCQKVGIPIKIRTLSHDNGKTQLHHALKHCISLQ